MRDITAFMRSPDGRVWLDGIRDCLQGRSIRRVTFAATENGVATTLHLDNKETYRFTDDAMTLEELYERYSAFFWNLHSKTNNRKET